MRRNRPIDLLSAGEFLVDFISRDYAETLDEAKTFERIIGGSPANLCMNMARLGNRTKLVASVGNDDMGSYLRSYVERLGVDCADLAAVPSPTTLILVTRTRTVANFEAYRGADFLIRPSQLRPSMLAKCSIFHTTCFALSRNPAQRTILSAAAKAAQSGVQLSIDANYAAKIWPDRREAQQKVVECCRMGAIVKVSEVDWERLYEQPLDDAEKAARHFTGLGARIACVTLGSEGCYVASAKEGHFLPSRKVEVKDTTGAGDSFWSGFLTAWLDGHSLLDCAKAGRRVAEIKIGIFGALPDQVDRQLIYSDF
jgi:fructokinase